MMDIGDALNTIKDAAAIGAPTLLAILPLVVVLRNAPPMPDETTNLKPCRRRLFGGWRITISITRNEAHS